MHMQTPLLYAANGRASEYHIDTMSLHLKHPGGEAQSIKLHVCRDFMEAQQQQPAQQPATAASPAASAFAATATQQAVPASPTPTPTPTPPPQAAPPAAAEPQPQLAPQEQAPTPAAAAAEAPDVRQPAQPVIPAMHSSELPAVSQAYQPRPQHPPRLQPMELPRQQQQQQQVVEQAREAAPMQVLFAVSSCALLPGAAKPGTQPKSALLGMLPCFAPFRSLLQSSLP
jgi:hypothetical protein